MDTLLWERARGIFDAALDLPLSERPAFLKAVCRDDDALRTEVESLLEADSRAVGFLESGWFSSHIGAGHVFSLHEDDTVCGRYRVLRRLGEGGMGEVYQAYDTELGVFIALKTLRPDVVLNPEVVRRFRQEVRIARQITHPNVCRTFNLEREVRFSGPGGSKTELTFITMEYLDGETLQQKLRRDGRLRPEQAFPIARQMAAALDAAHSMGIVHRDIKPGNVMLCAAPGQSTRIVVTDFGLAKSRSTDELHSRSSLSQPGNAMGTLAYMSPEQVEAGEVGPATDIYSFGLVLFEMVTGEKAWSKVDSLAAAHQRAREIPVSPRSLEPELPAEWEAAILGCLRTDPKTRFTSAADVLTAIEGVGLNPLPAMPSFRARFPAWQRLAASRAVMAAVCLAFASLLVLALRLYLSEAGVASAPGTLIYLAPVRNETGEQKLDNVIQLLRAGLNQSPHIRLLDAGSDGDYLRQMAKSSDLRIDAPVAREIAMRAGATRVVLTTLAKSDAGYQFDVEVEQTDSDPLLYRNRWTKSFTWNTAERKNGDDVMSGQMLAAIRDAGDWIRTEVGESPKDIAQLDISPGEVTTKSWQALTSYTNAEKLIAKGRKEDAIAQFQEAIQRDPGFARAHAGLADNLISMGRREEGYQEYANALNSDSRERLSRKERDFIKGTFANDTRDYATALAAFRDYSAFYEYDFDAWFYQAYPLDMLDRPTDAIHALERADPLGATPHMVAGQMVYNYLLLGDHAVARHWTQELIHTKHLDLANTLSGIEAFLAGDYSASSEFFKRNQQSNDHDYRFMGYTLALNLLAEQGRYPKALEVATEGLDALGYAQNQADDTGVLWADRGSIECHMEHFPQCLTDLTESLRWNTTPDEVLVLSTILGDALPHLAPAERKEALALFRKMEGLLPSDDLAVIYTLARTRVHGELELARHDTKGALAAFRRADTLDAPLFPREYLARGLLAAAATTLDRVEAQAMREEALRLYAHAAMRPASIWRTVWYYPPGFAGDQMDNYLALAKSLGRKDTEVESIGSALAKMRPAISTTHPTIH